MKIKINQKARVFYTFIFVLVYLVIVHTIHRYEENKAAKNSHMEKVFKDNLLLINQLISIDISTKDISSIIDAKNEQLRITFDQNINNKIDTDTVKYKTVKLDNSSLYVTLSFNTQKLDEHLYNELFEDILIGCLFLFFVYPFLIAVRREIRAENEYKLKQEKILSRQHRLAQMGQLLSNIAHQFRQPLSQINALMASLEVDYHKNRLDEKQLDEKIGKVEDVTEYLSHTIEDFRNYFKTNKQKDKFLISEAVEKSINILSSLIKENSIDVQIDNIEDKELYLPSGEYIQVVISLITNSIDELIQKQIQNPTIIIRIDNSLQIKDNAGGIKQEHLDKVFDLDFTTKESKKGTGLGLYMTKMLVENSFDGQIEVQNYEEGVLFKIDVKGNDE